MTVWSVVLSLAVGGVAGTLAQRFRLPGGLVIWSLASVAGLHLAVPDLVPLDPGFRIAAQIMIGIVLGAGLRREPFQMMRRVLWPITVAVTGLLGAAIIAAVALSSFSGLPLFTAVLAVIPGGATDITAVALELEEGVAIVAGFQIVRQLSLYLVVVTLIQFLFRNDATDVAEQEE